MHKKSHHVNRQRSIFIDPLTEKYWWKNSIHCGCGHATSFLERVLSRSEYRRYVLHGGVV